MNSNNSILIFPSGRSVSAVKKDAKKLAKTNSILLSSALDQLVVENGLSSMAWSRALLLLDGEYKARKVWLELADAQDYENTWRNSSEIFKSAIEMDDWRKSLKAARSPLGSLISRELENIASLNQPDGAPDGNYTKLTFESSFKSKHIALETVTLVEEADGHWRVAGYFIR